MSLTPQADVRECRRCGTPFVYRVNVRVAYCSHYCYQRTGNWANKTGRPRTELRVFLENRRCVECGGEMDIDLNTNAKYCDLLCKQAANAAQMRQMRQKWRRASR